MRMELINRGQRVGGSGRSGVALLACVWVATSQFAAAQVKRGEPIAAAPPVTAVATNVSGGVPAGAGHASGHGLSRFTALSSNGVPVEKIGDYWVVGFDTLSAFPLRIVFKLVDSNYVKRVEGIIPLDVKAWDGKRVAITGFMMPLVYQQGFQGPVTECLILRNQAMCCFGQPPQINEWILVRMNGEGIKAVRDVPVTVFGKLHVEEYWEKEQLRAVYRLEGDKMEIPDPPK